MPARQHVCTLPGCPTISPRSGRCPQHRRAQELAQPSRIDGRHDFYTSTTWRTLRASVLHQHPTCQHPDHCNNPATDVDHIQPISHGGSRLDRDNLQALCHPHHSQKTAHETAFGGDHG